MKTKNRIRPRISLSLPSEVIDWINAEAARKGISVSAFTGMTLKETKEQQQKVLEK